jgi:hypothetical protein
MTNLVKIKIMKILIYCFFLILSISCSKSNCNKINSNFTSYDSAIELVKSSDFSIEEKINTDSSWINSIEYCSCDKLTGFLIVNTKKGKSYIHENVPIQLWYEFKNANSFGRFYNQNVKGNYFLSLN